MLPLCISLSFPSSFNISSIVKSTTELLLNSSNVLLLLWVECMDDFRSGSDVAGVFKLLLICGMKVFVLFEKLFWLHKILPLGELVWKLNSDCTCVSKFSCNKYSFVFGLKLWEDVWILAFNKTVKSVTSPLKNVFSLSACSSSFTFKSSFSTTKSLSHIISERFYQSLVFGQYIWFENLENLLTLWFAK